MYYVVNVLSGRVLGRFSDYKQARRYCRRLVRRKVPAIIVKKVV